MDDTIKHMRTGPSFLRLAFHVLIPSVFELLCSLSVVVALVGAHILILSFKSGVLAPGAFGLQSDAWVTTYNQYVLQPLGGLLHNSTLNVVGLSILWGVVGCVILGLLEFVFNLIREARRAQKDVVMTPEAYVRHPLRRTFFVHWLWRFFVGFCLVVTTVALLPAIDKLLLRDMAASQSGTLASLAQSIAFVVVSWMGIIHLYVMEMRLFVLRTRVFGELIY